MVRATRIQTIRPKRRIQHRIIQLNRLLVIWIGESQTEEFMRILTHNHRRTSLHLPVELLSRADLGEALGLFSRMLDRLD